MSRLEIIHLRSPGEPLESLGQRIKESIGTEKKEAESVTLYRRDGLETDLVVHIHHRGVPETAGPSDLACHLASALRRYGLVEHAVWEEMQWEEKPSARPSDP